MRYMSYVQATNKEIYTLIFNQLRSYSLGEGLLDMGFSSLSSCCFEGEASPFSCFSSAGDRDLLLLLLLLSSALLDLLLDFLSSFSLLLLLDLLLAADLLPLLALDALLDLDLESLLLLDLDLLLDFEPPRDLERDLLLRDLERDLDLRADLDLERDLPLDRDLLLLLELNDPSGTNLILLPFNSVSSILSMARFMSS